MIGLCKTLENLQVEVLILDPKSKFFGLVENDNNHNSAWINCLESLVDRFGVTILFTHHETKARAGSQDQASSRGGSALTDGCRWVANLRTLDSKTGQKFQLADPHNYVELVITKSNYAAKLPAPIYFRRGAGGALTYVELGAKRIEGIAKKLLAELAASEAGDRHFSRRDLLYEKSAKPIADAIKDTVPSFNRVRDINLAVDHLLAQGLLKEERRAGRTGPEKTILRVFEPVG